MRSKMIVAGKKHYIPKHRYILSDQCVSATGCRVTGSYSYTLSEQPSTATGSLVTGSSSARRAPASPRSCMTLFFGSAHRNLVHYGFNATAISEYEAHDAHGCVAHQVGQPCSRLCGLAQPDLVGHKLGRGACVGFCLVVVGSRFRRCCSSNRDCCMIVNCSCTRALDGHGVVEHVCDGGVKRLAIVAKLRVL